VKIRLGCYESVRQILPNMSKELAPPSAPNRRERSFRREAYQWLYHFLQDVGILAILEVKSLMLYHQLPETKLKFW